MSARTHGTPPVRATAEQSAEVFAALRAILSVHAKELKVTADSPKGYSLNTPYSDRWKKELFFGAVQVAKNYVSFHLFPVYMYPDLLEGATPELKARMQGKSCFNFRAPDAALFAELAALAESGLSRMKAERAF